MTVIQELHRTACEMGADTYKDPGTGYQVFTEYALLKKGDCCGNACRHCPYGHIKVNKPGHEPKVKKPVLLGSIEGMCDGFDVLFWSGGKDSFLCLSHLLERNTKVVLLTTFETETNRVPLQNIHIKEIVDQANHFNVPVCLVPLSAKADYLDAVSTGFQVIEEKISSPVTRICFGDLHLHDLRDWRIQTWPEYEVFTPLFSQPYKELLALLWKAASRYGVSINLSTEVQLPDIVLPIGTTYNQALVERLQSSGLDAMLEFGEGHTYVMPKRITEFQPSIWSYKFFK